VKSYRWKGPVFGISAVNGEGCRELTFAIQEWLDAHPAPTPVADATIELEPVVVSPAPVSTRRRKTAHRD